MRWTLLAALFAACCATTCLAETPELSGNRPQAMQLFQGRLFSGQGWWNRYGEPVNAAALAEQPAENVTPAGPMPAYGDGYIYGPGACDCPPPCISHLWNGYYQNPKRCHAHVHRHCGCANGTIGGDECAPGRGMLAKIFGHGCCNSCGSNDSCSCTATTSCSAPVSCTSAASDCGCKPVCCKCRPCHLANKWRGFTAHWNCGCDSCSCSAPASCGCATATPEITMPSEKQALQSPPRPIPEEVLLHPLPRLN